MYIINEPLLVLLAVVIFGAPSFSSISGDGIVLNQVTQNARTNKLGAIDGEHINGAQLTASSSSSPTMVLSTRHTMWICGGSSIAVATTERTSIKQGTE